MNLAVVTTACYPTRDRIHLLDKSAIRQKMRLDAFGIGVQFSNWKQMLLEQTLPSLEEYAKTYSHVLYVDAADTLFVGSLPEILAKYERFGSPPCFMSSDLDIPTVNTDSFKGPLPWRFLNAGGFITKIEYFVGLMKVLSTKYSDDGDYQNWLIREWPIPGMFLDHECTIFQSMCGHPAILPFGARVLNSVTGSWPCVLHFRGGYSDPQTGRDERMIPWCKQLWGEA